MAAAGPQPAKELNFGEVSNLVLKEMEDIHFINGMSYLHFAASRGWIHCFPALLKNGMRPSDIDFHGNSAVVYAVQGGHKAAADWLLDPLVMREMASPLLKASMMKEAAAAKTTIIKKPEVPLSEAAKRFFNRHVLKSLVQAIIEKNTAIAVELIEKKPQLNDLLQRIDNKNLKPVELAINYQLPEIVKALVANGCSITDVSNKTSVLFLTYGANNQVLNAILEGLDLYTAQTNIDNKKALLNIRDEEGETALYHAVLNGNFPNVKLLLTNGADPYIANIEGVTPFQIAKSMSAIDDKGKVWEKILTLFIENSQSQSASASSSSISSPISSSVSASSSSSQASMSTSAISPSSSSAFIPYSRLTYLKGLDQSKITLQVQHYINSSPYPLHEAAKANDVDALDALFKMRFPVDRPDFKGNTPLHIACQFDALKTIAYLVSKGALKDIPNRENLTAFDIAKAKGSDAVLVALKMDSPAAETKAVSMQLS